MNDINKVVLAGTIYDNPNLSYTLSGNPVPVLRIVVVTKQSRLSVHGELKEEEIKHWVVLIGEKALNISDNLREGDGVLIEGRMKTRWKGDEKGKKVFITEVIASEICLIKQNRREHESVGSTEG